MCIDYIISLRNKDSGGTKCLIGTAKGEENVQMGREMGEHKGETKFYGLCLNVLPNPYAVMEAGF